MAACLVQQPGGLIVGSLLLLQLVPTPHIQQDSNPGPPGVRMWVQRQMRWGPLQPVLTTAAAAVKASRLLLLLLQGVMSKHLPQAAAAAAGSMVSLLLAAMARPSLGRTGTAVLLLLLPVLPAAVTLRAQAAVTNSHTAATATTTLAAATATAMGTVVTRTVMPTAAVRSTTTTPAAAAVSCLTLLPWPGRPRVSLRTLLMLLLV